MPPRYPLASVEHALEILGLLRASSSLRVSDVAQTLGVANSTAHRLLATLAHRGFVEQDAATRRYRLGQALLDIGTTAVLRRDPRPWARPALTAVAERLDETTHLGVLEGAAVHYIDAVESTRAVRVASRE